MSEEPAVRVCNVSKYYRLWDSPRKRLVEPLKWAAASIVPGLGHLWQDDGKSYVDFPALHDVSLEILHGESWGLIGMNGSGKSTLLQIISGNLRPSAGHVEVNGKTAILNYGAGLSPEFTGKENIYLKGAFLGLTTKEIDERYDEIVKFADIGQFINQPVKTYSSGMGARLGFAIMIHAEADIIISDEALAVGDAFFIQKSMRAIREFLKRGTFIFVSHSINNILSMCDYAAWLDNGKIVRVGKAKHVCQAYNNEIARLNSPLGQGGAAEGGDENRKQHLEDGTDSDVVDGKLDVGNGVVLKRGNGEGFICRSTSRQQILLNVEELSELYGVFAPKKFHAEFDEDYIIQLKDNVDATSISDIPEAGTGDGRIFEVSLTNEAGESLLNFRGGEITRLTIRAVANKEISFPFLGFLFKNHQGLSVIGHNTEFVAKQKKLRLLPGQVISVSFTFQMPLLGHGQYVILAAMAALGEDGIRSYYLDVRHEAILIRSVPKTAQHGMVNVGLMGLSVGIDQISLLEVNDVIS